MKSCTETIIRQVSNIEKLVSEFSILQECLGKL